MTDNVLIYEVGPRDGLQNEARFIATPDKIALVDLLSEAGLRKIEVTSFVSPKWVPQMTDATAVMAGIRRLPDVTYAALTPNLRGAAAALQAQAGEIAIFASASESFSQKNINCSIEESLERFAPVAALAQHSGMPLRGYVSCVTDCPYGGSVDPVMVAMVAGKLLAMGCYQVSLGDTLGRATPARVGQMLDAVMATADVSQLAGHFHDTSGSALANISVCLARGIRTFDAAVGGLGGCPYAPGAEGNVATEAVVDLMAAEGFETGIDRKKLLAAV
jgi:hydroxymethylglutaryl-CoA lyase